MPSGVTIILNVVAQSQQMEKVSAALEKFEEVTDLFEVTGEYDLVAVMQTASIVEFRKLMRKILRIDGIKGTNSMIVIHSLKRNRKPVAE